MIDKLGYTLKKDSETEFIMTLEISYECAGICDEARYYTFTDINRGPPKYTEGCFY